MDNGAPTRSPRDAGTRDLLGPRAGHRFRRAAAPANATLAVAALVALVGALAAAGQAAFVIATGEELCLGGGCAIVGRLTRISPALFNGIGASVFAAAAALAWLARRSGAGAPLAGLRLLLVGALAAEGVLVGYQWHVAGAWCTYCLGILGLLALLNLLAGARSALFGAAGFGAVLVVFSLLSFVPQNQTIDHGTLAVRGPTAGAPEIYVLFSETCPHCQRVLAALDAAERCSVRYNPVEAMPADFLAGTERNPQFDPAVNVATAKLLGLRTIPVLLAREPTGLRVVTGESAILAYVADTCTDRPATPPAAEPFGGSSLLLQADDGCGIAADCD